MKIEIDGIEFKDNLDEICFLEAKKNGDEMILFYTGAYMAARRAFLEYGKKKDNKN